MFVLKTMMLFFNHFSTIKLSISKGVQLIFGCEGSLREPSLLKPNQCMCVPYRFITYYVHNCAYSQQKCSVDFCF